MSRSLIVLLAVIALLAGALWYASSTRVPLVGDDLADIAEPVPTGGLPATELVGTPRSARREEPADEAARALRDTREPVPTALAEELASAHWIEGRVVFPPGTPADEEAWVVAHGRDFEDGSDHRARVAPDGSFRVAFSERTRSGGLALEARYLYLLEVVRWKRGEESTVVLEPELGGRLIVTVFPPPGSSRPLDGSVSLSDREARLIQGGMVEWGGLQAATYTLTYRGDSFAAEHVSAVVEVGATSSAELHLRSGVSLAGVIVDEEGVGVADAFVGWMRVEGPGDHGFQLHPQATQTDALGRFRLGAFLAGETRVDARSDGFLPGSLSLGLLSDGAVRDDLTIVLSRGLSVSGTVTWPDGRPAEASILLTPTFDGPEPTSPDAIIARLENGRAVQGESGTDGCFTITGLADLRYALLASASTKEESTRVDPATGRERTSIVRTSWKAELESVSAGSGGVRLVLSTGIHLRGHVVDERGEPVERFTVRAEGPDDANGARTHESKTFRAADGSFDLEGLSEGEWRIEADARGHAPSAQLFVTLPSKAPVELVLAHEARVRGTVLDAGGEPLAGVTVRVFQNRPGRFLNEHDVTDDRGEFELGGLFAGRTTLITEGTEDAPCEDYILDLAPEQEVDGIVLRLRMGGTLLVEVVNARAWMFVSVRGLDGRDFGSDAPELDVDGRCVVSGLPEGTFEVTAREIWGLEVSERFTLGRGGTASVRLLCPTETTLLRGVVTLGEEVVAGASVSLHAELEEPTSYSATHSGTEANGEFTAPVPSGRTLELVVRDEHWSWTGVIDVPAVSEHTFDLSLLRVSGRVGGASAGAPDHAMVVATGGGTRATGRVDGRGGFDLALPRGTYRLALESLGTESDVELVEELHVEGDLDLGELVATGR